MHTERLTQLANYLRALPVEQWDFDDFVSGVNDCGTVGCALGHCATIWPDVWTIVPKVTPSNKVSYIVQGPYGLGCITMAEQFFGLDREQSYDLFLRSSDMARLDKQEQLDLVINRIESLVNQRKEVA